MKSEDVTHIVQLNGKLIGIYIFQKMQDMGADL